jgi:hypothetical protein
VLYFKTEGCAIDDDITEVNYNEVRQTEVYITTESPMMISPSSPGTITRVPTMSRLPMS